MLCNPGQVIYNRYRITKLLGQGGFGAVYRAWDLSLKRPCALKQNFETSPEAQEQFEHEAIILARLNHPHLPRVTDHFILPGEGQFLVMDYVEGQDLQEVLDHRGGSLPENMAIPWIEQVCDALSYLHSQTPPIIHRDIKPANIKITPQGNAVLVDFGIAKVYDPLLKTTRGARAVTPGYSPLEQYGRGSTDVRSDVYALGAMLYTLLTGRELPESTERAVDDKAIPAGTLNPSISPGVAAAVTRATQLAANRRFQSVADFKNTLRVAKTLVVPQEAVESASPRYAPAAAADAKRLAAAPSRRLPWKKWLPWIGLAAVGGVIGIGLLLVVVFWLAGGDIPGIVSPTETPSWTQTLTKAPTLTATFTPVPTLTPDFAATEAVLEATASAMEAFDAIQIAREWPVLVWDGFDDNQNEWMVGEVDDEFSTMYLEVDGQYIWDVVAKQGFIWRVWPRSDIVSDFYLAVEAQNLSDNLDARYGLVFWNDQSTYYYVEARDSGLFLVSYYDGQAWNNMIDYTESDAILAGEVNTLEIAVMDETFYFLINGVLLAKIPGLSPSEGQAGVAVGLSEAGEQSRIAFDNYMLRAPKSSGEE